MKRRCTSSSGDLGVGFFGQEKINYGFASVVFERRGNGERGPARTILNICIEGSECGQEADGLYVVKGAGPVNW